MGSYSRLRMRLALTVAVSLLVVTLSPGVYGEETDRVVRDVEYSFKPDPRFLDQTNAFNMTEPDLTKWTTNLDSWAIEANGTYSGAVLPESTFELDFKPSRVTDTTAYISIGTAVNFSSSVLLSGTTEWWVRLPFIGDHYAQVFLTIWEDSGVAPTILTPSLTLDAGSRLYQIPIDTEYEWATPYTYPYIGGHTFNGTLDSFFEDDRWYVRVHQFLYPDTTYYFVCTAVIVGWGTFATDESPQIALTEENHSRADNKTQLVYGETYPDNSSLFQTENLTGVEAGWSFVFEQGHGAGVTGVRLDPVETERIYFNATMNETATGRNISLMIPVVNRELERVFYRISIKAYNATRIQQDWWSPVNGSTVSVYNSPILNFTEWILLTPEYSPGNNSTYYEFSIFILNTTLLRFFAFDGGSDGFILFNSTGFWNTKARARHYHINLFFSAQYTELAWAQVEQIRGGVSILDRRFPRVLAATKMPIAATTTTGERDDWDFMDEARLHWDNIDWRNPYSIAKGLAMASITILTGSVNKFFNGIYNIYGTLKSGFSYMYNALESIGHFLTVWLPEIIGKITSLIHEIVSHLDEVLVIFLEIFFVLLAQVIIAAIFHPFSIIILKLKGVRA